MRIAIIAPTSLSYMPYLLCYTEILDQRCISYDLYYWNRYRESKAGKSNYHEFSHYAPGRTYDSWIGYMKYRSYLKKILRQKQYDLIIVLSMQIAVLLADILHHYRYILDIRDYSYENHWIFRQIEGYLLKKSRMNVISSNGFREWLPDDIDYVLCHNVTLSALKGVNEPLFNMRTKMVLYIGAVGYFQPTVEILRVLANHEEISLFIVGQGLCERKLEAYCRREAISNVQFAGKYMPDEKRRYLEMTNFVMAVYGNKGAIVSTAVPNKLYDACLYGKPIIVSKGTHLSSLVKNYGLGIVFDPENAARIVSDIYLYYNRPSYEEYLGNRQRFLTVVEEETLLFHQKLMNCLDQSPHAGRP